MFNGSWDIIRKFIRNSENIGESKENPGKVRKSEGIPEEILGKWMLYYRSQDPVAY
jgi:hypothetical protein